METLAFTKRIISILFVLLLASSSSISHAAEPLPQAIGQVVWVKNTLKAHLPNAEARTLARRSPIYEHDTLITDPASSGEIAFTDDSALALQENSTVTIDQYKYGKGNAPSEDTFVVNVLKGGFRTVTGVIAKNNPGGYKATTPVATIGVSGTVYSLYFDASKKSVAAKIDKGSIVLKNQNGEVTLTKCGSNSKKGTGSAACVNTLYAEVKANSAPKAVADEPVVFSHEPLLTGAPNSKKSGLVGSFCIN